jgi:hypothetical protein
LAGPGSKVVADHIPRDLEYPGWQAISLLDRLNSTMDADEDLLENVLDIRRPANPARDKRPQTFVELAPDRFGFLSWYGSRHRHPQPAGWAVSTGGAQHVDFCDGSQHAACSSTLQHEALAFAAFAAKNRLRFSGTGVARDGTGISSFVPYTAVRIASTIIGTGATVCSLP